MRDALGVKAGDRVRYVISEDRVQVFRMPSGEKVHAHDSALLEALDAAENVMDENRTLLRELKIMLVAEILCNRNQKCKCVIRPDVRLAWESMAYMNDKLKRKLI